MLGANSALSLVCCVTLGKSPNLSEHVARKKGGKEALLMPCASSLTEYDLPLPLPQLGLPLPVKSLAIISTSKEIRNLSQSQNLDLSAKHWGSSGCRKQVGNPQALG